MSIDRVPKNFEDLLEWDQFIRGVLWRLGKGRIRPEDMDDLSQEVVVRVMTQDYLSKYDPEKGKFTTYLFWLIRTVAIAWFKRNTRDPLRFTVTPDIEESSEEDRLWRAHAKLHAMQNHRAVLDLETADILARLDTLFAEIDAGQASKGKSFTLPDGTPARRGLQAVWSLARQGYEAGEIAKVMGMSVSSVFAYLRRIKTEGAGLVTAS